MELADGRPSSIGSCVRSLSLATNPASSSKTRLVMSGPLPRAKNADFQICGREITLLSEKIEANPGPPDGRSLSIPADERSKGSGARGRPKASARYVENA